MTMKYEEITRWMFDQCGGEFEDFRLTRGEQALQCLQRDTTAQVAEVVKAARELLADLKAEHGWDDYTPIEVALWNLDEQTALLGGRTEAPATKGEGR